MDTPCATARVAKEHPLPGNLVPRQPLTLAPQRENVNVEHVSITP